MLVPPRPLGRDDPSDVTSFHPGQWNWSPNRMPDILYVWRPPPERAIFKPPGAKGVKHLPPPKRDAQGSIMYERWPANPQSPRMLLDFKHLPDQIGTNEWWWVFEAWRRYDPRIRWIDILMRQYGPSRSSSGNANGLQMLVCRNRPPFKMITWEPRPDALGHDTKDTVSELLTPQQIQHNTTRGHTPGLIDPNLPDTPRNRIPIPTRLSNAGQHKGPRRPGGAKPRKRRERATVGTKIGTGNSPKQDNRAASEESGRSQSGQYVSEIGVAPDDTDDSGLFSGYEDIVVPSPAAKRGSAYLDDDADAEDASHDQRRRPKKRRPDLSTPNSGDFLEGDVWQPS
ncbi:MAG: hypothetical protein L6R40_003306 [Gallowayella cf. fulva]|nr:MAG: hypothetical protein L6R40_003306 [Xanthomendoza cf. fulva]